MYTKYSQTVTNCAFWSELKYFEVICITIVTSFTFFGQSAQMRVHQNVWNQMVFKILTNIGNTTHHIYLSYDQNTKWLVTFCE